MTLHSITVIKLHDLTLYIRAWILLYGEILKDIFVMTLYIKSNHLPINIIEDDVCFHCEVFIIIITQLQFQQERWTYQHHEDLPERQIAGEMPGPGASQQILDTRVRDVIGALYRAGYVNATGTDFIIFEYLG